MFKTRLLSGILLVIIALITVITGGSLLFGVLLLISLIGMTELYKVFGIEKKAPGVLGYIFAVGYYALLYFKPQLPGESLNWFMMLFMGYLICQMAVLVFAYPKYNTQQILAGFFGLTRIFDSGFGTDDCLRYKFYAFVLTNHTLMQFICKMERLISLTFI